MVPLDRGTWWSPGCRRRCRSRPRTSIDLRDKATAVIHVVDQFFIGSQPRARRGPAAACSTASTRGARPTRGRRTAATADYGPRPPAGSVVGGRGGTPASGGTSATGGGGAAGSGGTTSCTGLAPNEELIDDMNDGDRFIPQVNGRAGAWADSDDGSPGRNHVPRSSGTIHHQRTRATPVGKYAAYVHGGPFVLQGADFWFGLGSPYNASAYTGISFWAKIDSGTSSGLRVAFPRQRHAA